METVALYFGEDLGSGGTSIRRGPSAIREAAVFVARASLDQAV
jgi:hypothetical protein